MLQGYLRADGRKGVRKVYDGHGRRVEAIADLTFTVEPGALTCVVGPSGCGI